jgi:hypothetical protein
VRRLAERQDEFAAALLDWAMSAPAGLLGPDGEPSPRRFAVYRNNVVAGLSAALRAAYPAVRRIVGEEFFRAMARTYALAEPPASPILLDYGAGFPAFIAGFAPAASLPYLPDVARIERAWSEAYHASEATPLAPAAFAAIAPERLADMRLTLHPSLGVVRSTLPALTIWRMNIGDGVPAPVDLAAGGEDTLVARPAADVEVRATPPGGAIFVTALSDGRTISDAFKLAAANSPLFDLAANLAALIGAGSVVRFGLAGNGAPMEQGKKA